MKKIRYFGIIIVVLISTILTGCSDDSGTRDSMTFVDDLVNPGREFIIYDNLGFTVQIFEAYFLGKSDTEMTNLAAAGIVPGLRVWGSIYDTNDTWTSSAIAGTARNMGANNSIVTMMFSIPEMASGIGIILSYTKDSDDYITGVKVEFTTGDPTIVGVADNLMGATYTRKD